MKNLNRFLIEIFASFTFLCLAFPGLATGAPFAYITNSGSDSVSVIDTATNTVVKTVAVGISPLALRYILTAAVSTWQTG